MSGAEQVDSFNPLLVVLWMTQLLFLYLDYSSDQAVSWSIPIIGSFFFIQVYMIWKTNYDKMQDEERDKQIQALGGPIGVPEIVPGQTNLKELYKVKEVKKSEKNKENIQNDTIYLNSPANKNE